MSDLREARKAAEEASIGPLIAAFMAGWGNSAEGYNAEYGPLQDDVADTARHEVKDLAKIVSDKVLSALRKDYAIVPREASEEMLEAAVTALEFGTSETEYSTPQTVWSAMIAAYEDGEG